MSTIRKNPNKADRGLCVVVGCRQKHQPGKGLCLKHKNAAWKESNPSRYHWHRMRHNATKRGIEFLLTYEDYVRLWQESGKWDCQSPKPKGWEIDRIHRLLPYSPENCRVLEKSIHARKSVWERGVDWDIQVYRTPQDILKDCPF